MSTPAASAASKLASVLPGAIRSAPLWPTRRSGARLISDIPGTSMSCGCASPCPSGAGSAAPQRGHGCPACRTRAARSSAARRAPSAASAAASPRRPRAPPRRRPRPPAATDRPPPPSSPRPSRCSRCRRRCAGRAARRRSRASGRRRAAARRKRSRVERRREHVGAERRQPLVEARARPSVISSSAGRRTATTQRSPARSTIHARARRCASAARRVHAPRPDHAEVRVQHELAVEAAGTGACRACRPRVTARPASRSGQRSSAWRGCGVRISSGTRPSSTGPDPVGRARRSCRPQARRLRRSASAAAGPPGTRARPAPARAATPSPARRRPSRARGA